jgi:hypothetical protein
MEAHHQQVRRYRRNSKSDTELDAWLAVAKEVLAGNKGPRGETHGCKRVKMHYSFVDHLNKGEYGRPLRQKRIEDLEID